MTNSYEVIKVDQYKAVQLQEYKGIYGLLALNVGGGENETYYKQWVFLSKWSNGQSQPTDMRRPMGVRLGDKETAIKILEGALREIKTK